MSSNKKPPNMLPIVTKCLSLLMAYGHISGVAHCTLDVVWARTHYYSDGRTHANTRRAGVFVCRIWFL